MGLISRKKKILASAPHLATATGSVAAFSTDLRGLLNQCQTSFTPVQSGSGDPSPENVRPITGWTGCNVVHTGANLFDITQVTENVRLATNGTLYGDSDAYTSDFIEVEVGQTCIKNSPEADAYHRWCTFNASQAFVRAISDTNTITIESGEKYVRMCGKKAELSTATVNTGNTYPVTFPAEAGTVYGGYVDLVTGVLTVTQWINTLTSSLNWNIGSNTTQAMGYHRFYCPPNPLMKTGSNMTGYADKVPIVNANPTTEGITLGLSNNQAYFLCAQTSVADFKDWFNETFGEIKLVYPLATPITYQLTPQQIKSLKGQNNVWSNTNGTTTVQYWKH